MAVFTATAQGTGRRATARALLCDGCMPLSDRAFHALAHHDPEAVLATMRALAPKLLAGEVTIDSDDLEPTRLDALAPTLDADWIARVGERLILHVECQGYRDAGFLDRLFRYHLTLVLRHPTREVRTVALWLTPPTRPQRRESISRGQVTVRVTQLVLAEVAADALLASPATACFAPGADAGALSDIALCRRVAALLADTSASWYRCHMAFITAHNRGRYEAMKKAMLEHGMKPVIIEDIFYMGEDQGLARGRAEGRAEGLALAVTRLCDVRGLLLTEPQRARVTACTDLALLERWLSRAATARDADDVFA